VFVNQLDLTVALEENAEIIKPGDHALKFHAVHEKDRDRNFIFANVIEESVLKILFFLGHFEFALGSSYCCAAQNILARDDP
jgi:hypothetical protein